MKYRPEIDGLRGLAVVPVILFHAGFELFRGGYVGVDVFFVISGYLITTILIEDIQNERFSIIHFYERRARRILPALFLVMFVCIPFAWIWMLPTQIRNLSQSYVAVVGFASNILFWLKQGYFDTAAEEKPFIHTWSLAVEEQFYVIFPISLLLAWRFGKNRAFLMIVVVAVMSFIMSEVGRHHDVGANFYLAPTRAWELLAGSVAAFIVQERGVRANNAMSFLGLSAIIFSIITYDESTPFPSVYTLAPVMGVVLLVLYADSKTFASKLLSTKAFVGIGLVSYSAYLWHQPIFAFARIRSLDAPSDTLMLFLIGLSLLLAYLSWRFVEQPFRDKRNLSRKTVFIGAIVISMGFGLTGLYGHLTIKFEQFSNFQDKSPCVKSGGAKIHELNSLAEKCFSPDNEKQFVLIGDSHAESVSKQLRAVIEANGGELITLLKHACFPLPGTTRLPLQKKCLSTKQAYWAFAKSTDATILVVTRWRLNFEGPRYDNEEGGVEYGDNGKNVVVDQEGLDIFSYTFDKLVKFSNHNKIVLFSQIPEAGWDVPRRLTNIRNFKNDLKAEVSTSYLVFKEKNKRVLEWLDNLGKEPRISVIYTEDIVCDESKNRCLNTLDGKSLYRDDDHPSPLYSSMIADKFKEMMLNQ